MFSGSPHTQLVEHCSSLAEFSVASVVEQLVFIYHPLPRQESLEVITQKFTRCISTTGAVRNSIITGSACWGFLNAMSSDSSTLTKPITLTHGHTVSLHLNQFFALVEQIARILLHGAYSIKEHQ